MKLSTKKIEDKTEEQYWYATKPLIKQLTEGKCLICGEELQEEEIDELIKEEHYEDAGICRKCR